MGYGRSRKAPINVGDLVICHDTALRRTEDGTVVTCVGLVLDTSLTICKIQVIESSKIMYFPLATTYLYEEGIT